MKPFLLKVVRLCPLPSPPILIHHLSIPTTIHSPPARILQTILNPKNDTPHEGMSEGTRDNTHQPSDDTNDSPQEEYMWMPREVYQDLLMQLQKKDTRMERKDSQQLKD